MDSEQLSAVELREALARSPCEKLETLEAVRPALRLSYLADPAERLFVQAAARAGYQAALPPLRSMDWTHHMDLLIQPRGDGPARSVDVKNFKRLRRTLPCQDRYLCVELRNVRGRPGWVTVSGPDLIAVRLFAGDSSKGTFVLLDRGALHAMVEDHERKPPIDSRDVFDEDGSLRLRTPCTRAGRADCFVWIPMLDAIAGAAVGLWSALP